MLGGQRISKEKKCADSLQRLASSSTATSAGRSGTARTCESARTAQNLLLLQRPLGKDVWPPLGSIWLLLTLAAYQPSLCTRVPAHICVGAVL